MTLKHALVLVLVLVPSAAHAGCEAEAIKARQMIMASGPFHYNGRVWGTSIGSGTGGTSHTEYDQRVSGMIVPYMATHILEGPTASVEARERIIIGNQAWLKGDPGWFQPQTVHSATPAGADNLTIPPYSATVTSVKCLGSVEIEGKNLTGYELENLTRWINVPYTERVFVEPSSALTVRYETKTLLGNSSINFVYDSSIKIEPPAVAPDAPPPPFRMGASTKF